jgi:hypothetical protein
MKVQPQHRLLPVAVVALLVVAAVVVAGVRGSVESAVVAASIGGLIVAYLVRHQMRSRLIYDRHRTDQHHAAQGTDPADAVR